MKRIIFVLFILIFVALNSESFTEYFNDNSDPSDWAMQGDYTYVTEDEGTSYFLRLTHDGNSGELSSAFYKVSSFQNVGWTINATIRISSTDLTGEGLTFVWVNAANISEESDLIGPSYPDQAAPLKGGYGFEFDHSKNQGDANSQEYTHVVALPLIVDPGTSQNLVHINGLETNFSSDNQYYENDGWIDIELSCVQNGNDANLTFKYKHENDSSWETNQPSYIISVDTSGEETSNYDTFDAYFGITAATASTNKTANHDIKKFSLTGTLGNENPLPVTLSSFTATYLNGNAQLQWVTQSETNNLGWNIYRGINDNADEAVQINYDLIPGAGTTSDVTNYNYFDESIDLLIDANYLQNGDNVWYWLESRSVAGSSELFDPVVMTINNPDGDDPTPDFLNNFGLMQNYPNPFNPETSISFSVQEGCEVELDIFNIRGQKVKTLFNGYAAGDSEYPHTVKWDGTNEAGTVVESGIYFYRLKSDKNIQTRKMILMQ